MLRNKKKRKRDTATEGGGKHMMEGKVLYGEKAKPGLEREGWTGSHESVTPTDRRRLADFCIQAKKRTRPTEGGKVHFEKFWLPAADQKRNGWCPLLETVYGGRVTTIGKGSYVPSASVMPRR